AVLGFGLIWVGSERGLALRIGMFCFCAFRSRIIRNLVSVQWVTVIGGMCYSMYLLHHGLISIFGRFLARQFSGFYFFDFVIFLAMTIMLILLVSGAFFRLIEKP